MTSVAPGTVTTCRSTRLRWWVAALAGLCGFQAMAVQSLFLREAVVLMSGSELAWGIVLGAWLLGIAFGGAAGGWLASRSRRQDGWLAGLLPGVSAAACLALWAFRGGRGWLGVPPGELLPLTGMLAAAGLLVTPASILVGMTFPFLCAISSTGGLQAQAPVGSGGQDGRLPGGAGALGRIYALESAGSLIGGAWISFWAVDHLGPMQTLLLCAALACAGAAGLLLASRSANGDPSPALGTRAASVWLLAVGAGGALVLALAGGGRLNEWLIQRRWRHTAPGYERVAERETRYQNLALGWREEQFTLLSNGQVSASFPDPYTAAPLAHFWMCQHPRPARVLLIGGVAEGLLGEILLHPVERVDCVEPDPGQIELIEPHLDAAGRQALGDPRVTLHHQDTRHLVKMRQGEFDLVIARLPEPTSAMRARFYSRQFYAELRRAMAEDGVLCMMAPAAPTHLSELSCAYLASLRATLYEAFPSVLVTWGDPACILAATREGLVSADPTELAERYSQRNVHSGIFSPLWFDGAVDLLDAGKIAQRAAELDSVRQVELSTDQRPAVYLQRLELLERMTSEPAGRIAAVTWLRRVRLAGIIAAMGGMAIATLALCRLRAGKGGVWAGGALVMSVGTTGFATMALSIIWLFAFQNLYGYVYARIGWIIALFMGGLMVGSAWGGRKVVLGRHEGEAAARRRLVAVDLGQALLAAAVPGVLAALGAIPAGRSGLLLIEITLSLMVGVTGVLCGAAFALAGAVRLAGDDRVGTAAGVVVGADHAGACLGAVLTGMLLVPVFGIPTAAGLLAGMKAAAGFALIITKRSGSRRL